MLPALAPIEIRGDVCSSHVRRSVSGRGDLRSRVSAGSGDPRQTGRGFRRGRETRAKRVEGFGGVGRPAPNRSRVSAGSGDPRQTGRGFRRGRETRAERVEGFGGVGRPAPNGSRVSAGSGDPRRTGAAPNAALLLLPRGSGVRPRAPGCVSGSQRTIPLSESSDRTRSTHSSRLNSCVGRVRSGQVGAS
jgi:hypothetical protein